MINGFYAFEPFINSHAATNMDAVGWTAFVGATIFEFGSVFGLWEAWNRDDSAQFGYAVEEKLGSARNSEEGLMEKGIPRKKWVWFSLQSQYFHELGFLAALIQFCGATIFWIAG